MFNTVVCATVQWFYVKHHLPNNFHLIEHLNNNNNNWSRIIASNCHKCEVLTVQCRHINLLLFQTKSVFFLFWLAIECENKGWAKKKMEYSCLFLSKYSATKKNQIVCHCWKMLTVAFPSQTSENTKLGWEPRCKSVQCVEMNKCMPIRSAFARKSRK